MTYVRCLYCQKFFFCLKLVFSEYSGMNNAELENRLIDFAVSVADICQSIKHSELGKSLSQQLIRSASSPALNYGEAQGAESKRDFIHKLRISLKELRESHMGLRIVKRSNICKKDEVLNMAIDEGNQLISIFVSSIRTAELNSTKL